MGSAILLRSSAFQWCVIHNQKVNSKRHTMVLVKAVPSLLYGFLLYEKIANFSNRPYLESGNYRLVFFLYEPVLYIDDMQQWIQRRVQQQVQKPVQKRI